MDDKELADKIIELYTKYADQNVVAEKLGISVELVKKHASLPRLSESLKDEVGAIKIPLDEIDYNCDSDIKWQQIDVLTEHIRKHGLLEPIVVCKSGNEKYEILAGYRRYCAYVVLNKNHPGEGWDKIPARSRGDCDGGTGRKNANTSDSPTIDAK